MYQLNLTSASDVIYDAEPNLGGLYNPEESYAETTLKHDGSVYCLRVSAWGGTKSIVGGGMDGMRLWDLEKGEMPLSCLLS